MRRKTDRSRTYLNVKTMPTVIEGIKLYTIPETALALKVHTNTVRAYVRQGKLKGLRIGRPIFITEKNIKEFLKILNRE